MSRAIAIAIGIASSALALASVVAWERVASLEARELEAASPWTTLRERAAGTSSARLLEATLDRGDEVTFELCARDAMAPETWAGLAQLAVVRTEPLEEMFALPIDARMLEGAARAPEASCVTFARVDALAIDGPTIDAAVEASWDAPPDAILDVPVRARILARKALGNRELGIVLGALLAAIAVVLTLASRTPRITAEPVGSTATRGALRAVLGLGVVLGSGVALGVLAPRGPSWGLVSGLALAVVEVAAAFALVRARGVDARAAALGLERPRRGALAIASLALAPLAGVALFLIARVALQLVPSTGEAPVEAFVSWPSGMLSFAALAVIAPIAEEVFFRGLVYGALRGEGGQGTARVLRVGLAIGGAWLLFAIAHLPQAWGNWGGMVSVLTAGLGFTVLRAATGSTLVPCLAHLVYNGLLASSALAAGAG